MTKVSHDVRGEHPVSGELEQVRVRVPAKINLALSVAPLGEDGYHQLATVFHAVSLTDEIIVRRSDEPGIRLAMKGEGSEDLPTDEGNLAVRAARLLQTTYPDLTEGGLDIEVRKQIPIAGGMAGGSSNAAGVLLACAMLWDLDTSPDDLHDLASRLGSDVPFALVGGNALGTGRGTELVPMLSRGTYHWVLAMAHEGLSTVDVYRHFDRVGVSTGPEVSEELLTAIASGDVEQVARNLHNDLEAPAVDLRPELGEVLAAGRSGGALGGVLSGSGPTCAFLAASEGAAMDLAATLSHHPHVRTVKRATGPAPGARPIG